MYNSFKDTIAEAYQQVELFNEIAGNFDNVIIDSLDNQLSFVFEELTETIDALESKDDKEYVDGLADIFVTVAGLLQKSEKAGYDVAEAIKRVNVNNLSKFPPFAMLNEADGRMGESRFDRTRLCYDYKQKPDNAFAVINERFSVIVFKNINTDKIMKPLNFVPVDLTGTYPDFLKGGA